MQVTLFTKPNCQLCDAIKYELLDLQAEYGFAFKEAFVETHTNAEEGEKTRVPFVHIDRDGQVILRFDFPVKQVELRRAIRAEMKSRSEPQQ